MKFFVIWTYIGNYSNLMEIEADTAENVVKQFTSFYSEDFTKKAQIYVFDKPPVLQVLKKND